MEAMLRKNIFLIFWGVVVLLTAGLALQIKPVFFILKPLLMPSLMVAVLLLTPNSAGRKRIMIALIFAFLGDVFLLYEYINALFFILGLIFFLLAHICYISYFILINRPGISPVKKYPYIVLLIAAYAGFLLYLLMPHLDNLKIPVICYACIISLMVYFSLALSYRFGRLTRKFFISGAIIFVISDSLLAIDKFYHSFSAAPVLIILTYCIAQYFIVKGFIRNRH